MSAADRKARTILQSVMGEKNNKRNRPRPNPTPAYKTRIDKRRKSFSINPPKPRPSEAGSWWTQLAQGESQTEVARRELSRMRQSVFSTFGPGSFNEWAD